MFPLDKIIKKHKHRIILIVLVVIAVLIGNQFFNVLIKKPYIGVIEFDGLINTFTKDSLLAAIRNAETNKSIKAVVLDINSPGGEASPVEEIYFALLELRRKKPIVASVEGLAASGSYYVAIVPNYIYAIPSSDIGSVGVISVMPERQPLDENTITTGTLKGRGTPRKDLTSQVQMIQESFLRAVMFQRGDRLKITKEELANAKVYVGFEALRLGLIDELGTKSDAIGKAAKLAHIRNYKVVSLNNVPTASLTFSLSVDESIFNSSTNTVPLNYYVYINPEE